MEYERLVLRTLFAWLVLHQLFRYAGKRTVTSAGGVGNRSGIDLMLALIVGDLIDDLLWAEVPGAQFVAAAGTLVLLHVALALLRSGSDVAWRALEGVPLRVIAHGAPVAQAMRAERLNRNALAALLRQDGIGPERWHEVRASYVENQGPLSVLREPWARPATRSDLPPHTEGSA
ncbi:MAG TPA: YetF domain-containing protein [Gemmatimonadales bacterium]|nr:YetF domain-containing protein [Gemmatimonadales bacterium]